MSLKSDDKDIFQLIERLKNDNPDLVSYLPGLPVYIRCLIVEAVPHI